MWIISLTFFTLLFNTTHAMENDTDAVLKDILSQVLKELKAYPCRNLDCPYFNEIAQGFDTEKYGEIVRWFPASKEAVTCWGGIYQYSNDSWTQLRSGEYTSQTEFFNSIYAQTFGHPAAAAHGNIKMHVHRNDFPLFIYHADTQTLMYPTHQTEKWRRCDRVHDNGTIHTPMIIAFERKGEQCGNVLLETRAADQDSQVLAGTCSSDGEYFAIHTKSSKKTYNVQLELSRIKVFKKLVDGTYGNDPQDMLTQGSDSITTAFDCCSYIADNTSFSYDNFYFTNHYINLDITKKGDFAYRWIISPDGQMVLYNRTVDCGNNTYYPLGTVKPFRNLYQKLHMSQPMIHIKDSRLPTIIELLSTNHIPQEIRAKILLAMTYKNKIADPAIRDKTLSKQCTFVYGSDDILFPPKEKKSLSILLQLKEYRNTVSGNRNFIQGFLENQLNHSDDVWHAAQLGELWKEEFDSYRLQYSQLLFQHLFKQLQLPPFKAVSSKLLKGEIILDPEGKVSINYSPTNQSKLCGYIRDSFYSEYCRAEKTAHWGTKAHAQQFIHDNTVKDLQIAEDGLSVAFILNNGIILSGFEKNTQTHHWPLTTSSGYWKSPYDQRTQEEIDAHMSALLSQ